MTKASAPQPLTRLSRDYRVRAVNLGWLRAGSYFWLLVAVAGGFALRVNRLTAQSLWNDEGTSVALGRLSLGAIADGAAHDIHPPLYYFLLHFWMELGGNSEFALRSLSVLAGVLLIAVTFRVARELFDEEVAVIAAFLSALSAFQLYYSQETRMYILVSLWGALSVWAMLRMLLHPDRSNFPWVAYVLTTGAALYTHYFAFTLVLFENLAFLVWLGLNYRAHRDGEKPVEVPQATSPGSTRNTRFPNARLRSVEHSVNLPSLLARWIAAQAVVILVFLPWLAFAGNQLTSWPAISGSLSLFDLVSRVLSAFVFKLDNPLGTETWIVAAYLIFFLAGLLPSLDLFHSSIWGLFVVALWALLPLAAMYGVSLRRPAYDPKFLLLSTPGFFILVARGLSILSPGLFLRERARRYSQERSGLIRSLMTWQFLLTFGIVAGGALLAVRGIYYDPRLQRDDYRGIARYIEGTATSNDAVLIDAPGQMDVFRYYYRGAAEVQTLPIGRPLQQEATLAALDDLVRGHRYLFAVFWATDQADPENVVERYLSTRAFKATDEWHGDVRLAQYALPSAFEGGGWEASLEDFGEEIELVQFNVGARMNSGGGADQMRSVRPGNILPIDLMWQALKTPTSNYKVFVHLLDAEGKIVSQRDTEPVSGFRPTDTWKAGEMIEDPVGLLVPAGTAGGKYLIEMGLYRAADGARLRISSGEDHLILDALRVE